MNLSIYFFIITTFLISTASSIWFYKKKENKWSALFLAFCINVILLCGATIVYSKVFHVKGTGGLFASLGILIFAFFIPVITCINHYTLALWKRKANY
ncbi:hypothetical protein [Evansella cellulosilytica]|uniref:hypothetical protein n=1 Tax=Evansella cellulosilytica TaxID=1413 RepID=UPI00059FB49A|nr:hypothetical protein [Evansella cellulosilytica]